METIIQCHQHVSSTQIDEYRAIGQSRDRETIKIHLPYNTDEYMLDFKVTM